MTTKRKKKPTSAEIAALDAADAANHIPLTPQDLAEARRWQDDDFAAARGLGLDLWDGAYLAITALTERVPLQGSLEHRIIFCLCRSAHGVVTQIGTSGAAETHDTVAAALAFVVDEIKDWDAERPRLPVDPLGAAA